MGSERENRNNGKYSQVLGRGHELLLTHEQLFWPGKNLGALRSLEPMFCKDKAKQIKNLLKDKSLLPVNQKKALGNTQDFEKEGLVASTSFKPDPELPKDMPKRPQEEIKVPGTMEERGKANKFSTEILKKDKGFPN
ncbi:hypothetical protein O181_051328 [Austropuccinia psidii MF-1]|uniref:Uncharacterized protein n=1 Tax=Austropuccinia psidii MF-1 TaxID=1389203 RepID=A0A9Q3HN89_9BASI|nr:hypothetical protein [Austropuccinia psidii MF-1]